MLAVRVILVFQLVICLWSTIVFGAVYQPPRAKVEPIHPRGLRMSIPDASGISLVAFHANINEDFNGLEAGFIARDIVKVRNGRWTYQDRTTELQKGDVIYYWIHVVYNGLGYNLIDQQHHVSDFFDLSGSKVDVPSSPVDNANCDASETKIYDRSGDVLSATTCSGSLIFHEDFGNENQINETTWTVIEQFPDAPHYEFNVYRNSPNNVNVKNGKLKITPTMLENDHGPTFVRRGSLTLEKCTGRAETSECKQETRGSNILPPVSSGLIDTRQSFAFTYGRILIRAKLPRGDWIYPLITLKPLTRIQNFERNMDHNPESSIEMRVVSSSGNSVLRTADGRDISGHMIWGGIVIPSRLRKNEHLDSGKATRFSDTLWSNDFHDYELEWRPRGILMKVDNVQYDFRDVDVSTDKPYYISIGLAVGGLTDFPDMSTSNGYAKPWRNVASKAMFDFYNARSSWTPTWNDGSSLEVDYVKVFAG